MLCRLERHNRHVGMPKTTRAARRLHDIQRHPVHPRRERRRTSPRSCRAVCSSACDEAEPQQLFVLRVTWLHVEREPSDVAPMVKAALAA
jgi:hypothetical protein